MDELGRDLVPRYVPTKIAITLLCKGENTVVDSDEVTGIFNAYFSSTACEIDLEDEHATPEEVISAY